VALAFVPVAAAVMLIELGGVLSALGRSAMDLTGEAAATYRALLVLGNGFILTAVLWGSALVFIIERRPAATALVFGLGSVATLFGLMHSPVPSGAVFSPWSPAAPLGVAGPLAGAYGALMVVALLVAARSR
jgi:AGZA family xanthine/uracil permease-like MFS transporter